MEAAARAFFSTPQFAVAGASQDTAKFGYKGMTLSQAASTQRLTVPCVVLAWYHLHNLPVTPLNPRAPSITVSSSPPKAYTTVRSPSALPSPAQTALSVITPPPVTQMLLEEAKSVGIKAVWLQPGTFDEEVMKYAKSNFEAAVGGPGGAGREGWCVLVDGEDAMEGVGRDWRSTKL